MKLKRGSRQWEVDESLHFSNYLFLFSVFLQTG